MKNRSMIAYFFNSIIFIGLCIFFTLFDSKIAIAVLPALVGGQIVTTTAFMGKTVFTGYMQSKHPVKELFPPI